MKYTAVIGNVIGADRITQKHQTHFKTLSAAKKYIESTKVSPWMIFNNYKGQVEIESIPAGY